MDKGNTTKVIAVAVVVIIIVAGIAAYMSLSGDRSEPRLDIDSNLPVYGNVNDDYTIDDLDLKLIEQWVKDGESLSAHPLADANKDGKLTSDDVDTVKKIIAGEKTNVTIIDQLDRTVTVPYPLDNLVTLRSDVCAFVAIGGFQDYIAGWSGSSQENIYEGLKKAGAEQVGTGSTISAASWAKIIELDTSLQSKGEGIGAIIVDRVADLNGYEADLDKAGIPYVGIRATDPYLTLTGSLLLGFLCGTEMQEKTESYVEECEAAMQYLNDKLATLSDKDRVHFISACMYYCVSGDISQYSKIGIAAGGICETLVEGDTSPSLKTPEAITQYDDLITRILNFSTIGFRTADLSTDMWGNAKVDTYMSNSAWYENMVFVNNSLPVTARVLYAANVLYPDLISKEYADSFLQSIVDNHMSFLHETQADGYFDVTQDLTRTVTYQEYQEFLKKTV